MNTVVKARHMDVTDAMRQHVESKVGKLPRFYSNIQSIETTLDIQGDESVVEIVVSATRKHTFVATHRGTDMYACVDQCLDKITRQIRRHKDRVRDRHAARHSEVALESPSESPSESDSESDSESTAETPAE